MSSKVVSSKENTLNVTEQTNEQLSVVNNELKAALEARKRAGAEARVAVAGSLSHMVPVAAGTDVVDPSQVPSRAGIADAFHEVAGHMKSAGVDHIMVQPEDRDTDDWMRTVEKIALVASVHQA